MGMIVGVALIAGWARAMARRAAKRSNKVGAATSFRFDVCDHKKFRSSSFGYLVLIFLPLVLLNTDRLLKVCCMPLIEFVHY